jgi:hypothetical protein
MTPARFGKGHGGLAGAREAKVLIHQMYGAVDRRKLSVASGGLFTRARTIQ